MFISLAKQNLKHAKGWKPKSDIIWKVCKDAAITTCSNAVWIWSYQKNGTGSMKAWQTKMKKKEMGKILTRIKSAAWTCKQNNMYYVPNQYQKLTDISNVTGNFLYLCQRFWSHTLKSVLTQLNMILEFPEKSNTFIGIQLLLNVEDIVARLNFCQ